MPLTQARVFSDKVECFTHSRDLYNICTHLGEEPTENIWKIICLWTALFLVQEATRHVAAPVVSHDAAQCSANLIQNQPRVEKICFCSSFHKEMLSSSGG